MSFAFESFQDFLAMGSYAFNVWFSFGIALGAMLILLIVILSQDKKTKQLVKRQAQLLSQKETTQKSEQS